MGKGKIDLKKENKGIDCILWAVAVFVLSFAVQWWNNSLFDIFFIFGLLVYPMLFALVLVCIVEAAKMVEEEEIISAMCSFIIIFATLVMFFKFPYEEAKIKFDYKYLTPMRTKVVNKIVSGEIDDSSSLVTLPLCYWLTTSDGTVFVYENDAEGVEVGFWVFRGMLSGSKIVVYSNGGEELIRKNESGYSISLLEQLGENWYYIETVY